MSVENSGSEEWEYKEIIIALKQESQTDRHCHLPLRSP